MSSIGAQRSPDCAADNCMEGDGWFTAAKLGRIFGPVLIDALGWVYVPVLASVHGLCPWPCYYILSLCSPLVQGPDEVGCIINVAASPVFCYGGGLFSKSNNCYIFVVILYVILSKTAHGLKVVGGASANRPKGRLLGRGWIKAALGKSPFMLG